MKFQVAAALVTALGLSACATMGEPPPSPIVTPSAGRTFLSPTPALTVTTYPNNAPLTRYWDSIPPNEVRLLLSLPIERAVVEEVASNGGLTLLGSGANLRKGRYRATYYYYRTRSQRCSTQPSHGNVFAGIGIRIIADIETTQAGVNVADLMGLQAAAQRGAARGQLSIEAIGISSETSSITPYLQASSGLTVDGLRKAVESFGVIKAIADTPSVTLTPYTVYLEAQDPEGCIAALSQQRAATTQGSRSMSQ